MNKAATLLLVLLAFAACSGHRTYPTPSTPPAQSAQPSPATSPVVPRPQAAAPSSDLMTTHTVKISTKFGDILIELDEKAAPLTTANFKKLVADKFYDGTTFHRVIPGFMIQGGDPKSKDASLRAQHGTGGPGYTIPAEIGLPHVRGSVATARMGDQVNPKRESSGSQFFICVADTPHLDGQYTVFGRVISGLEVVDQIVAQRRDGRDNPVDRVEMTVTLVPQS
jgi:cyclophilin family peptidyl-prolyl cis-trans isomerase